MAQSGVRLPDETTEKILALLKDGVPRKWIALAMYVSLSTVDRIARGENPKSNPQPLTPEQIDEMVKFYEDGAILKALGKRYAKSVSVIRRALVERGVSIRSPGEGAGQTLNYLPSPDEIAKQVASLRMKRFEKERASNPAIKRRYSPIFERVAENPFEHPDGMYGG